jgi:hypothetical protein
MTMLAGVIAILTSFQCQKEGWPRVVMRLTHAAKEEEP